jgi:acyl-coenzyme A thioesterase PaaI-like protein
MSASDIPAVFVRDGERFVPTQSAPGPWNPEHLHGGPTCGLLARALERTANDGTLQPARVTVDLFRPVPMRPLDVRTELVRDGKRIRLAQASIFDGELEVARASGLFLQRAEMRELEPWPGPTMPGPDGFDTTGLWRDRPAGIRASGFHTVIQTRWVSAPEEQAQAAWFRMPMELVEGEVTSAVSRAMAVGDFANAVASLSMRRMQAPAFINTDTTLYLFREPEGEWIGMTADHSGAHQGVGVVEVIHFDRKGRYGRSVQARLMMDRAPRMPGR